MNELEMSEVEIIENIISIMTPTLDEQEFIHNRAIERTAKRRIRERVRQSTWDLIEISDNDNSFKKGKRV
jgi:hypothetical protein